MHTQTHTRHHALNPWRFVVQLASLQQLPVGLAVSLLATAPLMALPLSRLEGDQPGWPGLLAGGLGFAGVLMLVSTAQG